MTGGVGLAAAIGVAVFGVGFVESTAGAAVEVLAVTEELLVTVGDTTSAIDGALAEMSASLSTVQGSAADGAATLTEVGAVTADLAVVISEDIPDSLDSIRAAMPQLIATAGVVDRTMRALRLVGVDYDPDQPLDDAIADIDTQLAAIPPQLRDQADRLRRAAAGVSEFGGDAIVIAEDVGRLRARLDDSRGLIAGYAGAVDRLVPVVDELDARLRTQAAAGRWVILGFALALALGQTLPMAAGYAAVRTTGPVDGPVTTPP